MRSIKLEDFEHYRRSAKAEFAPGHGHWIGDERRPAMSVAKEDMLWFLECADLVEEMMAKASALNR